MLGPREGMKENGTAPPPLEGKRSAAVPPDPFPFYTIFGTLPEGAPDHRCAGKSWGLLGISLDNGKDS
jgi:hypothetical protein